MAGMDAAGTLSADSGGFSVAWYRDWENAKYGENSAGLFSRLRVIRAMRGRICAATVTTGNANDSPYLREMAAFLPHGPGGVLRPTRPTGARRTATPSGTPGGGPSCSRRPTT